MIRKAIPVLTHVDNLSDMKIYMSAQEQLLNQIDSTAKRIDRNVDNISQDATSLLSSVGLPADESTSNTVIGLLKSISNKL